MDYIMELLRPVWVNIILTMAVVVITGIDCGLSAVTGEDPVIGEKGAVKIIFWFGRIVVAAACAVEFGMRSDEGVSLPVDIIFLCIGAVLMVYGIYHIWKICRK